jgi:hypothetical protein
MNATTIFIFLSILLVVLVVWVLPAGLIANAARLKGRTWGSFFTIGLATSWLVTSVIVATMPRTRHLTELVSCESCKERIGLDSSKCSYCGLARVPSSQWIDKQILKRVEAQRIFRRLSLICASLVLIMIVVLANLPSTLEVESYPDPQQYSEALINLGKLKLVSFSILWFFSLSFTVSCGAWLSREMGYPSLRTEVQGEPFYSTRRRSEDA